MKCNYFSISIEVPKYQQALNIPIVNIQQCYKVYGNTLPISDNQLCAGGQPGKDACSGFGGAPLIVSDGELYYQVWVL